VYLRHNSLAEDVPVAVVLKAMGIAADQEARFSLHFLPA
jgi:hypothetical protein